MDVAGLHFRSLAQQIKRPGQGREAVGAASLRVEIDKLPHLPGVLTDRLQAVVLHKHRRETFLLLDLHRVEHAAVGIDADEKLAARLKVAQHLCGVAHVQASYVLEETSPPRPVQFV